MTLENYLRDRIFYCATGIFFIARTGNSPYARPSRASPHAFLLRERATALTRHPHARALTRGLYQALQGRDR